MNKAQLIDTLADRLGGKKAANDAVEAVLDTIQRAVAKGERVAITGFGVFEKIERPARFARNPATGDRVRVKKTSVPKFKAGQGFKDVVSGAKKLPKVAASTAKAAAATATKVTGKTTSTASTQNTTNTTNAAKRPASARAPQKAAPAKAAARKAPAKKTTTPVKKTATKTTTATKKTTARKTPAKKA